MGKMDVCVKDIMRREVRTVSRETPLVDAVRMLRDLNVSSLVVERQDGHDAFGIITRKDVIEALSSLATNGVPLFVEDVMTKPAITVSPEFAVRHALDMMRLAGVRRLPVTDDTGLAGILSNTDVFRYLAGTID